MKTGFNLNLLKNFILFCAITSLTGLASSCQKETTEQEQAMAFVGTWKQSSRTVDGNQATIDSTRLILQIDSINICVIYDSTYAAISANEVITRSGWSYTNGLFNIAVDLPASYTVEAGDNELKMERVDFAQDGAIVKTILNYQRIASIVQE